MKFKNVFIGIAISLFSILSFFAVAEVAVRTLYPDIVPSTKYDWSSRHKGYPLEKAHTTFRIVVLGDSIAFGQGVKRDETFSKKLEALLNNYGGKIKFEVINLGFCGLNTVGEWEILAKRGINPDTGLPDSSYRGLAYSPDLIILEYTLNDSAVSSRSIEQIKEFDDLWRKGDAAIRVNSGPYSLPIPEAIDKFLTIKSRFYLFFMDRYNRLIAKLGFGEDGGGSGMFKRYNDDFKGWAYVKEALARIAHIARQSDLPVVLAVYPDLIKSDEYPFKRIHDKVIMVADSLGFYTLDLLPAFKGEDASSLWVSSADGHPNARAHEITAKAIYSYLVNNGLIPSF